MNLSTIWDGERHELDDPPEGAYMVFRGFEIYEGEELDPFETPSGEVILEDTQRNPDPNFPNRPREQAWGALSVCLGSFAAIAGIQRDQYQENHTDGQVVWSFKAKQSLGERV